MKNKLKLLGFIALIAIIGFKVLACDSSGGDPSELVMTNIVGSTSYRLTIGSNISKAVYTPSIGDGYRMEMTTSGVTSISEGIVTSVTHGVIFALQPSSGKAAFSIQSSGTTITKILNTITFEDGKTVSPTPTFSFVGNWTANIPGAGTGSLVISNNEVNWTFTDSEHGEVSRGTYVLDLLNNKATITATQLLGSPAAITTTAQIALNDPSSGNFRLSQGSYEGNKGDLWIVGTYSK